MLATRRTVGLAYIELLRFAFNYLCEADLGSTVWCQACLFESVAGEHREPAN
jgi:hypothetical protein